MSDFDSQLIAERIAQAKIPILSGIGHEIDLSITDMTAHTYAKTPTAIAQFLTERIETFCLRIDDMYDQFVDLVEGKIQEEKTRLKDAAYALQEKTMSYLQSHRARIITISEALKYKPVQRFRESKQFLDNAFETMDRVLKNRFKEEHVRLKKL